MNLRHPWASFVVAAVVLAVIVVRLIRGAAERRWRGELPVANADRVADAPSYARVRRRHRALLGAEAAALLVIGVAGTVLAMRPTQSRAAADDAASRDVMLCLDVSGSMAELDAAILERFSALAAGLRGERIGLTIWNGSAVTVFPLTDDYDYVRDTLAAASVAIAAGDPLYLAGTIVGGSSLIADGLGACVLRFDRPDAERSRSIILATDNAVAGRTILTLPEAAAMARERDVVVFGVAVAGEIDAQDARELQSAAEMTGGALLTVDDAGFVDDTVRRISERQARPLDRPSGRVMEERSAPWALAAAAGMLALVTVQGVLRR